MTLSVTNVAHRDAQDAAACRRLWASVLLAAYGDWWTEMERREKIKHPRSVEAIRAEALRYFSSRDGKTVAALAGITADPERMADVAIDPTARDRIKRLPGFSEDAA